MAELFGFRFEKIKDTKSAEKSVTDLLNSDARTLIQFTRVLNDGTSLINIAERDMNEQSSILIDVRELLSAADSSLGYIELAKLQLETDSLRDEFNRISNTSEFNEQNLIDVS